LRWNWEVMSLRRSADCDQAAHIITLEWGSPVYVHAYENSQAWADAWRHMAANGSRKPPAAHPDAGLTSGWSGPAGVTSFPSRDPSAALNAGRIRMMAADTDECSSWRSFSIGLTKHGFRWAPERDRSRFGRQLRDRRLHPRYPAPRTPLPILVGLVSYSFGDQRVSHVDYMRVAVGPTADVPIQGSLRIRSPLPTSCKARRSTPRRSVGHGFKELLR